MDKANETMLRKILNESPAFAYPKYMVGKILTVKD